MEHENRNDGGSTSSLPCCQSWETPGEMSGRAEATLNSSQGDREVGTVIGEEGEKL